MRVVTKMLAMAAVGIAAVTTLSAPANAATVADFNRCQHGVLCLFSQPNGGGAMVTFTSTINNLGNVGLDNNVRSAWNRSGKFGDLREGYAGGGYLIVRMSPYGNAFNIGDPNASSLIM